MGYSGARGTLINEKTWRRKSRVRLPLMGSLWYHMIQDDRKHCYLPSPVCPRSSGYILPLGLQCCTFDYIGGLQRVPTQPLTVHIQTYISLYPQFGANVLYFWFYWRPTGFTYSQPLNVHIQTYISLYPPIWSYTVLYFWLDWRPTACTYPASQCNCTHTSMHQAIFSLSMYTYKLAAQGRYFGFVHTLQRDGWRKAFFLSQEM